jgi:hypothetical protein
MARVKLSHAHWKNDELICNGVGHYGQILLSAPPQQPPTIKLPNYVVSLLRRKGNRRLDTIYSPRITPYLADTIQRLNRFPINYSLCLCSILLEQALRFDRSFYPSRHVVCVFSHLLLNISHTLSRSLFPSVWTINHHDIEDGHNFSFSLSFSFLFCFYCPSCAHATQVHPHCQPTVIAPLTSTTDQCFLLTVLVLDGVSESISPRLLVSRSGGQLKLEPSRTIFRSTFSESVPKTSVHSQFRSTGSKCRNS